MNTILLIVLLNPYYLRNLIEFLGPQYYAAANTPFMDHMAPNLLLLRGWSELIFGDIVNAPIALFFDYCALFSAFFPWQELVFYPDAIG
jgi:hypothetical protein